jgi:HlyD family secretion protein
LLLCGVALVAALVYGFRPSPLPVDLVRVTRGTLQVYVEQDGKTRIRQRYIVTAPLAGRMERVSLKPGDPVPTSYELTTIKPPHALLLDPRAREEGQARLDAAKARLKQVNAQLDDARASDSFARAEYSRLKSLPFGGASPQELDSAAMRERTAEAKVRANEFAVRVAEYELRQAEAALRFTQNGSSDETSQGSFSVKSPPLRKGKILRVMKESATVVTAGTDILEVGDIEEIEAEIDVLTTQAVKIKPGKSQVFLEHWGGPPLKGLVRVVEPSGFTKVSALGVEEQRVNVIVDFDVPKEYRGRIGDGYRVDARIIVDEAKDVLKVPHGALFRNGAGKWAVYVAEEGRAVLRPVKIGRDNGLEAEVLSGLSEGDQVLLHPSDKIKDGVSIAPRDNP